MSQSTHPNIALSYILKKNTMQLKDTMAITYKAEITDPSIFSTMVIWKIYYCPTEKIQFLLASGHSKPKSSFTATAKLNFKKFKASNTFHFEFVINDYETPMASLRSETCKLEGYETKDIFHIKTMIVTTPYYVPHNPVVFWLHYTAEQLPVKKDLIVKASLLAEQQKLGEKTFPLPIGQYKRDKVIKYPFSLTGTPDVPDRSAVTLHVEITEKDKPNVIATQKGALIALNGAKGVYITHVGFKREITLKETAYLIGELRNETRGKVKGS